MDRSEELKKLPIKKLIIMLSLPSILSFIVSTLNIAIDRIFIGQAVGTKAIAAVTVALGIQTLIQGLSQIISSGSSTLAAIELGKNNKEKLQNIIGNAFSSSIVISIIITMLGLIYLKPLLRVFGAGSEIMEYAMPYTSIMIASTILFFISQVSNNIIRGMGYAKRAMYNFLGSIITNTILDYVLMFIFKLGVSGAALATAAGYLVSLSLSLHFLISEDSAGKLKLSYVKIDMKLIKRVLQVGSPAFVMQLSLSITNLIFNHLCNMYGGSVVQAAYGIINTLTMILYMPIMGLCFGIQPIIGVNYGIGCKKRVKDTVYKAFKYSTVFCIILFLLLEIGSTNVAVLFGGTDLNFINITSKAIRICAIGFPIFGFVLVCANYFQYVGKAKQSIFFVCLNQIILLIPLAFVLPMFVGTFGIFASSTVSNILSFLVVLIFFVKEFKKLS